MRRMFIVLSLIFLTAISVSAGELQENETYRLKVSVPSLEAGSKFEVLYAQEGKPYAVRVLAAKGDTVVSNKGKYTLNRSYDGTPIEKLVEKSFDGVISGPLIIPFKYRDNTKTISGDTTLGYYAGYGWEVPRTNAAITPILSAGLTQVQINNVNKAGFTWAVGLLLQNWDTINVGLVYGQDRIGDSTWVHEGTGWWSASIGWKL